MLSVSAEIQPRPSWRLKSLPESFSLEDAQFLVEQTVLRCFDIPRDTLRGPGRDTAPVAFGRQVAIYVMHVHLGLSITDCARLFNRDRSTASHACRVVEDRRDSRRIDRLVSVIELALWQWLEFGRLPQGALPRELVQ